MGLIIDLTKVKEERARIKAARLKEWRKWAFRLIRVTKVFVAQHQHRCDYCICPVFSGDQYVREIWANSKHFHVKRRHWPECFAPTEDEAREMEDELEREHKTEKSSESREYA